MSAKAGRMSRRLPTRVFVDASSQASSTRSYAPTTIAEGPLVDSRDGSDPPLTDNC